LYFLAARELFRSLTSLVLLSAVSALLVSYVAMQHLGAPGAPLGVLVGESINLCGILVLSFCEVRRRYAAPSLAASGSSEERGCSPFRANETANALDVGADVRRSAEVDRRAVRGSRQDAAPTEGDDHRDQAEARAVPRFLPAATRAAGSA